MKHLFTLKSLLLTLVMLCGLNAWGATLSYTWDLTSASSDWTSSGNAEYFSQPYGFKKVNGTLTNKSIADFSVQGITEIKVGFKCLQNGATSSKLTIYLVDANGKALGEGKEVTPVNASAANKTTYQYATFTSGFEGATGFMMKVTKFGKNILVNGAEYTVTYELAVAKPVIKETSKPDLGSSYLTTSTATATIACDDKSATIKYAITGDDVKDAATIKSWKEGASVSIRSEVAGTKILWAKAVKEGKESAVASKEFTFATEPEGTYFVRVTDDSQIVEGAKYVITDSKCTAIANELTDGKYFSYSNGITDKGGVLTVDASTNYTYFKFENIADVADYKWHMTFEDNDGSYKYLTSSTSNEKKDLKVAESAETADGVSISFSGNDAVISFKNSYTKSGEQYRINSNRFKTYGTSTGTTVYLYRLVKEVPVETTVGLDKVINGKNGRNYEINCALRVNFKDANYAYASTTENNSSKKNTANEGDKGLGWSDKEEKFTQNDWVAIQNSGLELGNQVAIGSVATLVSNGAFPVIEFVSMSKDAPETPFEANTFRVANFNIGKDENAVKNVWLVAPQAGEYCHVRGYVAAAEGGKVTLKSAQESSTEIIGGNPITVDPVKMTVNYTGAVTTGNWFSFTGIVVNGKDGLELNAISAEDVSTGVEGVEASSVKVYGAEGVINVVSEEVAPIAVYSANGAIVSSVEASSASIAVAPGFYIVKAGNSVSKVTVK